MLVKDEAKTPEEIIQFAQLAASKMSVTLQHAAENLEKNWDKATVVGTIRSVAKQLLEDMKEWVVS